MDKTSLKAYLKTVLGLERAIYQNKQILNCYSKNQEEKKPKTPVEYVAVKPHAPNYSQTSFFYCFDENMILDFIWAISGFLSLAGLAWWIFLEEFPIFYMVNIGIFLVSCLCFVLIGCKRTKQNNKLKEEYERQLIEYEKETAINKENYRKSVAQYNQLFNHYAQTKKSVEEDFIKTVKKLQLSLNQLYAKNVIYGKYQNFVAVATIYEYIESGRCEGLEGPNGAYNLYESEIRANLIVSSLQNINQNLNNIKNNQYMLYNSIEQANIKTHSLLSNMNDTQLLTAYHTEQAAIAASADRISVGMTF